MIDPLACGYSGRGMSSHIEPKVLAASERSTRPGSTWASNTVSTSRTLRGGFASWRKSQRAGTGFPPVPLKRAGTGPPRPRPRTIRRPERGAGSRVAEKCPACGPATPMRSPSWFSNSNRRPTPGSRTSLTSMGFILPGRASAYVRTFAVWSTSSRRWAGTHPGGPKMWPSLSRKRVAVRTSRAIATYSWVCSFQMLNVSTCLVRP